MTRGSGCRAIPWHLVGQKRRHSAGRELSEVEPVVEPSAEEMDPHLHPVASHVDERVVVAAQLGVLGPSLPVQAAETSIGDASFGHAAVVVADHRAELDRGMKMLLDQAREQLILRG